MHTCFWNKASNFLVLTSKMTAATEQKLHYLITYWKTRRCFAKNAQITEMCWDKWHLQKTKNNFIIPPKSGKILQSYLSFSQEIFFLKGISEASKSSKIEVVVSVHLFWSEPTAFKKLSGTLLNVVKKMVLAYEITLISLSIYVSSNI